METTVNTVLGPISSSEMGVTLIHEHLKVAWLGWAMDPFNTYDLKSALKSAIDNMKEVRALGVSTVVDPLPMGLGRDPNFHAEVARASGVNIIISTGLDYEARAMPPYFRVRTTDEIADVFVNDLQVGIGDTGIKAGIIKAATGEGVITKNEGRALRAAARASVATGVPIVTHTTRGTMGVEQARIFLNEGVAPGRVMIGHCCFSTDTPYLVSIMDMGCSIGFDQIGLRHTQSDEARLATLTGLLTLGYADRILLSQDHTCCIVGAAYERLTEQVELMKENRHSHIFRKFLPRLSEAGVDDATIHAMMADNPRRLFEQPGTVEGGSHE